MANQVIEAVNYKNFTGTTTITSTASTVKLLGVFVASTTAGTLAISDGATTVVAAFSPSPATFYPIPAECNTSLVLTVTGTLNATAFYSI